MFKVLGVLCIIAFSNFFFKYMCIYILRDNIHVLLLVFSALSLCWTTTFFKITSTQIHENQWIGQVQRTYWYTTVHTCKYSERLCFSKFRFGIESIEFFIANYSTNWGFEKLVWGPNTCYINFQCRIHKVSKTIIIQSVLGVPS